MQGIELSKKYYEEYGKPLLENDFSNILSLIAVGFTGSGSEHYGFDDAVSADHDFEPGFCIFLPDEAIVDRKTEFKLERAYAKLPKEFCGVKRLPISPVGGNRHGVMRTKDFYSKSIGTTSYELPREYWLHIPDYVLAEATNGEIWFDGYGEVSHIRKTLLNMPHDIRLKRIAGNLLIMAQSGQYNYLRCLKHSENEAAQLACNEFINAAMKTVFLLHNKYMPYYKWSFRALRQYCNETVLAEKLSHLLTGENSISAVAEEKHMLIEEISEYVINFLRKKELTAAVCNDLEKHAYSVNDKITDNYIRNMSIFAGTT